MTKRAAAVGATRRRIIDATRELHHRQGIGATSWDDIARRAGVGVGTVYRHFRSLDELIPACGEVSLEIIDMPDPELAPSLFLGAVEPAERMHRLVSEVFAMYDRGETELQPMLREPDVHPLVRWAARRLEAVLAALVDAALEPLESGRGDRRVVRAMIDFGVWRALRDQGLGAEDTVAAVAEMLACRVG